MFQRSRTQAVVVRLGTLTRAFSSQNATSPTLARWHNLLQESASGEADTPSHLASRRPPSSREVDGLLAKFISAVQRADEDTMRTSYDFLKDEVLREGATATESHGGLSSSVAVQTLVALLRKDSEENRFFVADILKDISSQPAEATNISAAVFDELLERNAVAQAHSWLLYLRRETGRPATLRQVDDLMRHCGVNQDVSLARTIIESLNELDCPLTKVTIRKYMKVLYRSGYELKVSELRDFFALVKAKGVTWDSPTLSILRHWVTQQRAPELAAEVDAIYLTAFDKRTEENPDERLADTARTRGKWPAVSLLHQLQSIHGFIPTQKTLEALVRESQDVSVLRYWEKVLQVTAGPVPWSILLKNVSRQHDGAVTSALYRTAISSGVPPTKHMLHPVLRSLCSSSLKPPAATAVEEAYQLYKEYISYVDANPKASGADIQHEAQLDAPIYNTLLRALCSSSDQKHIDTALELLEDMKSRKINTDSMTMTSVAVLFIRCASGYAEAFEVYKRICRAPDAPCRLDELGYTTILSAFCRLSTPSSPVPSARLFFEIVKDMRNAGHKITPRVYTIILQQLIKLAADTPLMRDINSRQQLAKAVLRTHQYLNVEAAIKPDTALWNQLMDCYQRAGMFVEAYRIWDSLYRGWQFNDASISIILDGCAHADQFSTAEMIISNLFENGYKPTLHHWNGWLECLCQLGRMDEALKALCMEMGRQPGMPQPDENSAHILLKFATGVNREAEVRSAIKRHWPALWKSVSQNPDL